jgi:hypothetical protein
LAPTRPAGWRTGRSPAAAMRYQHAAGGRDREIAALLSKLADDTA